MMAENSRLSRALAVSCVFHLFMLLGLAWLAGPVIHEPAAVEQVIELELAAPGEEGPAGSDAPAAPQEQAMATPPQAVQQQSSPRVLKERVPRQAAAPAMATEAAETAGTGDGEAGAVSAGGGVSDGNDGHGPAGDGSGNGGGKGSQGLIPPGILSKVEPVYPQAARNAGQSGTVMLRIQILPNGRSGNITVTASSGYGLLDDAAVNAVRQWRFIPAKDRSSGKTVACYTTLPVTFQLNS